MSKDKSLKRILAQAKEKKKKYDWLKANDLYEQALHAVGKNDFLKKGKVLERIGYCFYRAAFQAETREDFKTRIESAVGAYDKAAESFDSIGGLEKLAKISHCRAMVAYVGSWIIADLTEKRKKLDECWKLEREALRVYEKTADYTNLGKTCNNLMIFLTNRLDIEWDAERREKIIEEALEYGKKAIEIFSKAQDKSQLAQAQILTAFFYKNAAFARGFKVERREECRKKALSYPQKAVGFSEEIGDAYLIALSSLCLANARLDITGSTGLREVHYYEKALQHSILTKDNLLIADTLYGLEFATRASAQVQEDPNKAREEYRRFDKYREDALARYNIIAHQAGMASAYCFGIDIPIEQRAAMEANLKNKRLLIEEAVKFGYKGLEHARLSGSMGVTFHMTRALSWVLVRLARVETNNDRKRDILEESSRHIEESISILDQASALSLVEPRELNLSNCNWSLALVQAELANAEEKTDEKIKMLRNAIAKMRIAREYWQKWVKSPWARVDKWIVYSEEWVGAGITEMIIGKTLNRLYALTNDVSVLSEAIEAFKESIKTYGKVDSPFSRVAESYWQLAKAYSMMGNYTESTKNFELASENYLLATKKIPQLKDFYQDQASYMQAWSEIEKAHAHHARQEYKKAKDSYEKAADLHKSTERWSYLGLNYLAWARLEEAEDLSRREQTAEAKDLFQQAAKLFLEAKESIKGKLKRIETRDEKQMATDLVKASDIREQYCLGRIALEEAKILDRQGDHAASSRKYDSAAEMFQKAIDDTEREADRQELRPIVDLCRAWQMMTRAEVEASPDLYSKASQLFEEVKEHSLDDRARMLALGHSRFCKALEAGAKFEDTRDAKMYSTAKKHLEAAESYYLRAGFKDTSEFAKATNILFDAYMYMHKAETEVDPTKKAQYYKAAEKLLQASAGSYMKAKHPEKNEEVKSLLESVKEKRQLATSVTELLHGPTIASTTLFSTLTPTHEQAVGLERFEHAVIEAHLEASEEVTVGQEFEIRLDLVNVAQNFGLLVRVDDLVSPSFEATVLPSQYRIENGSLDMRGKRLEPLKVESIKLSLRANEIGVVNLSPKVIFVDDVGKFKTSTPKPVTVTVHPKLTFEFKTATAQRVFDFLVSAFLEDYMRRRISLETSGWRTLMQIVKQGKVPKSSVYGTGGRRGQAISELERRGLVETRVFPGERGRGGKILKIRISYEKETVKRHVDQHVMKIKEK